MTALAFAELTRGELADAAGAAVLVLPFGAVEQHGPRLPFGTDAVVVEAVARAAAARVETTGDVVVAPTFAYGSSHHHLDVGGALSLGWDTFAACVADLLRSAAAAGFRRVFVLNGHGGNDEPLHVAGQAAAREHDLHVGGGSYWNLASDELAAVAAPIVPGHAGRFEAALVLALGGRVDATPVPHASVPAVGGSRYWHEHRDRWREIDGFSDDPTPATAGEGAAYLDAIVTAVARCITDFDRRARDLESQ